METALKYILTNAYKEQMISWMDAHPEAFDEAFILAVADEPRYSWRAAWLLWSCLKENDPRIQPNIKSIIDSLPGKNDNHKRELIKILLLVELSDEYEGILFDVCISLWEKIHKKPSLRHNALKMIVKIAANHPGLAHEIEFLLQDQYLESLSPGVRRSVLMIAKKVVY